MPSHTTSYHRWKLVSIPGALWRILKFSISPHAPKSFASTVNSHFQIMPSIWTRIQLRSRMKPSWSWGPCEMQQNLVKHQRRQREWNLAQLSTKMERRIFQDLRTKLIVLKQYGYQHQSNGSGGGWHSPFSSGEISISCHLVFPSSQGDPFIHDLGIEQFYIDASKSWREKRRRKRGSVRKVALTIRREMTPSHVTIGTMRFCTCKSWQLRGSATSLRILSTCIKMR